MDPLRLMNMAAERIQMLRCSPAKASLYSRNNFIDPQSYLNHSTAVTSDSGIVNLQQKSVHYVSEHFKRMRQLANDFFAVKNDPEQLDVDESVMEQLQRLHPATLSEEVEGDGPVVWVLLIPTSENIMHRFLRKEINEKEVLSLTPPGEKYEAVYLCSALVLPEYRGQGRALRATLGALDEIRSEHPIRALFVWPFSEEGSQLARQIADRQGLPLHIRSHG
jgi:hypothetical protein